MRRLARLSRPLTALFALWFAIVLGDPGVLHACPMHGGHGSAHSAAASTASAHEGHAGHAGHGGHTASAAVHGADADHHGDTSAPCTCVGHCCAAPAAAPISPVTVVAVVEVVAEVRHPAPAPPSDPPAAPDRRLPFPNGPPTA